MIKVSEKKISGQIYCWSLDPEDSFTDDINKRVNRDAAARIYAFGEVTSTCGQVASSKKESASTTEDVMCDHTIIQAAPLIGERSELISGSRRSRHL